MRSGSGIRGLVGGLFCALGLVSSSCAAEESKPAAVDHSGYSALLARYVTDDGVRYAAWKDNADDRAALTAYIVLLAAQPVSEWEAQEEGRDAALAYWINLYNAVTLDLVLESYPLKSIKDLGGLFSSPWKQKLVTVEGDPLTLNGIENEIIRPRFQDARIHFALNCAARSCPPLRAEAFVPDRLEVQLDEQRRKFLTDERFVRRDGDKIVVSKIFDWYKDDFVAAEGSVEKYLRKYLEDGGAKWKIKLDDYDWSLNESS